MIEKTVEKYEYNNNNQVSKKIIIEKHGITIHTTIQEYKYNNNGQINETITTHESKEEK